MVDYRKQNGVVGVVNVSSFWDTVIVLPVDEAAQLAKLIVQGLHWSKHYQENEDARYQTGYMLFNEKGEAPSAPTLEILNERAYAARLEIGDKYKQQKLNPPPPKPANDDGEF